MWSISFFSFMSAVIGQENWGGEEKEGVISSLTIFIESCEVQLSSAIVVCMLQYLIRSLRKHAQNMSIQLIHRMKKNISRVCIFLFFKLNFKILFIQKYFTVKKK